MTRILVFPFIGDSIGGAQLSALSLIKCLDKRRFVVRIVLHELGTLSRFLEQHGLEFDYLPIPRYAGIVPKLSSIFVGAVVSAFPIYRFIKSNQVALVHCNDLRTNLTWLLATRLAGIQFVWHQRTQTFSSSLFWRFVPLITNHVIAISKTSSKAFGGFGRKLSVIENPFDQESIDRLNARERLLWEIGAPDDGVLMGYVGRLVPSKRADLCIELLGRLRPRCDRSLHLIIVGAGNETYVHQLEQLCSKIGVVDHVYFLGFRFPISVTMAGLDLLIAPSEHEGFGRTIVESMLVGTPVVASDIAAHKEIIENNTNGFLAVTGDLDDFTDKASRILASKKLGERLASNAKAMALRRFSSFRHSRDVERVYDVLLASHG